MTPVLLLGWRLADVVKDVPDVASDVPAVGAKYLRRISARRPEMLGFSVSLKKQCQKYGTDPIARPMPGLMTLSATRRRTGSVCSAMYTTPHPPSPIFWSNL